MMLGGGFWEWLSQFGGWGVLIIGSGFFMWLLATGRLYTATQVDREVDRYKEAIKDQKEANNRKDQTIDKMAEALPEILAYVRLGNHALSEIRQIGKGPPS